jgi:hypothetical protein
MVRRFGDGFDGDRVCLWDFEMRIKTSENYHHDFDCDLANDCERRYCSEHRLLWRDCDTAITGYEGDRDLTQGLHLIWDLRDCPDCEHESRIRKYQILQGGAA